MPLRSLSCSFRILAAAGTSECACRRACGSVADRKGSSRLLDDQVLTSQQHRHVRVMSTCMREGFAGCVVLK